VPGRQKELIRACRLAADARFHGRGADADPGGGLRRRHRHL
jgi:hypothetical protein